MVCHEGVTFFDAGPVSFQQKLAVVNYLLSDGAGEPAFEFVPFGTLAVSISVDTSTPVKVLSNQSWRNLVIIRAC